MADAGISLILLVAFSLVVAGGSVYIVNERLNGEKLQQKLCNVSFGTYWGVAFTWDFIVSSFADSSIVRISIIIVRIFSDIHHCIAIGRGCIQIFRHTSLHGQRQSVWHMPDIVTFWLCHHSDGACGRKTFHRRQFGQYAYSLYEYYYCFGDDRHSYIDWHPWRIGRKLEKLLSLEWMSLCNVFYCFYSAGKRTNSWLFESSLFDISTTCAGWCSDWIMQESHRCRSIRALLY